jgi:hypothetical protein
MHLEIAAMPHEQCVRGGIAGHTVGQRIPNRVGNACRDVVDVINGLHAALPFAACAIKLLETVPGYRERSLVCLAVRIRRKETCAKLMLRQYA